MEELDLKELISIFMEKKILIIAVIIIFAIAGAVYTNKFIVPMYQSKTKLVLVQVSGEKENPDETNSITTTDITLNSKLVENYREIAKSENIAKKVIQNLGINKSVKEVQKNVSVTSVADTELIEISVIDEDPEQACRIAKEVANVFIDKVKEIYNVSNVNVLDEAEVNTEPSNIHLIKNIVIFVFIGLIIVSIYILLINMLDTTIKTDTDIEKAIGVPVLASIMLTDDTIKKKLKSNTEFSSNNNDNDNTNVHVSYEHNSIVKNIGPSYPEENENISIFSYMNGDNTSSTKRKGHKKEKNRKKRW